MSRGVSESQTDISELLQSARQAFKEKRLLECIPLLKAALDVDPENYEARLLEALVQADLEMDAKASGEEAATPKTASPRRTHAASSIENEDQEPVTGRQISVRDTMIVGCVFTMLFILAAQYMRLPERLAHVEPPSAPAPAAPAEPAPAPPPVVQPTGFDENAAAIGTLQISVDDGIEVLVNGQYAGTAPVGPLQVKPGVYEVKYRFEGRELGAEKVTVEGGKLNQNARRGFLGSIELFVLPASNTMLQLDDKPASPVPTHLTVRPGAHRLLLTAAGYQPETISVSVGAGKRRNLSVVLKPVVIGLPTAAPVAVDGVKGSLAVGSLLPVDIYMNGNRLGSTPMTMDLPAGTYTLEYRFGDLRKTETVAVKSREVTRTTVAFDATLQITSSPQAEIFLDGPQPKRLGATPLTGVRAPIGGRLIFRAAGYPDKTHTVTEKDVTISVAFP